MSAIASRFVIASMSFAVAACSSFGDSPSSPADAGPTDGGSSGGDGEAGPSPSGCTAILCSDFDVSTNPQQPTKPNGKPWLFNPQGAAKLSIEGGGLSSPNALRSGGDGTVATFDAQVTVADLVVTKDVIRLSMAVRVRARPILGDAYFATLEFAEIRFIALMHADGTLELAQAAPPSETPPTKSMKPTPALAVSNSWSQVEIRVDRRGGQSSAELRLNGSGAPVTLEANPSGPARVGIGIGYCDAPCGQPSLEFDDVVLREE